MSWVSRVTALVAASTLLHAQTPTAISTRLQSLERLRLTPRGNLVGFEAGDAVNRGRTPVELQWRKRHDGTPEFIFHEFSQYQGANPSPSCRLLAFAAPEPAMLSDQLTAPVSYRVVNDCNTISVLDLTRRLLAIKLWSLDPQGVISASFRAGKDHFDDVFALFRGPPGDARHSSEPDSGEADRVAAEVPGSGGHGRRPPI